MNQIEEFFKKLFDTKDFPARWHCGRWTDFHGWLYIISDFMIWSAYFAIPLLIIRFFIQRNRAFHFNPLYLLFAAFILACGTTHLIDFVIFWVPVYRFSALMKLVTGIVSWITVFYLVKALPEALSLKSPRELEAEIERRKTIEMELSLKNKRMLEAERIARLCYWVWDIRRNIFEWSDATFNIFNLPPDFKMDYDVFVSSIHPADREFVVKTVTDVFITKDFRDFDCRILLPGGEVRHVSVNGEVKLNELGQIKYMIGTVHDVTKEVLQLNKIKQQNDKLFEIANIQSHDVRGPVASILGLTRLFNVNDYTDPDNRNVIEGLQQVAERLDAVVKDIIIRANIEELK